MPNQLTTTEEAITGVILAGGKSSRYGKNKALETMGGVRLIERVVESLRPLCHQLIIITNTPREYAFLNLPMYEDIIKGLGPLGGIYTGLTFMGGKDGFFVACDMPFLNSGLIRHVISVRGNYDAVVPRVGWKMEALHALYSRKCLPYIKGMIDAKQYQIIKLFQKIKIRYVEEPEIRGFDPHLKCFVNVNRPEELTKAEKI